MPLKTHSPAVTTPYTNEIPVRKIDLFDSEPRTLTKERDAVEISVKIFPENATFRDIEFKCCTDNGVEISFAKVVSFDGKTATLKAFGDGKFRLRAYSKNGTDIPKIISELEYTAEGLGKAEKGSLYLYCRLPLRFLECSCYHDRQRFARRL